MKKTIKVRSKKNKIAKELIELRKLRIDLGYKTNSVELLRKYSGRG